MHGCGRRLRDISIHAPRAGCDCIVCDRCIGDWQFQSTHPVRGATANMYNLVCSYFCNFTKSDVCLLTLYLFYHVVFSRFSAVRSAPKIHVCFRFALCQRKPGIMRPLVKDCAADRACILSPLPLDVNHCPLATAERKVLDAADLQIILLGVCHYAMRVTVTPAGTAASSTLTL